MNMILHLLKIQAHTTTLRRHLQRKYPNVKVPENSTISIDQPPITSFLKNNGTILNHCVGLAITGEPITCLKSEIVEDIFYRWNKKH